MQSGCPWLTLCLASKCESSVPAVTGRGAELEGSVGSVAELGGEVLPVPAESCVVQAVRCSHLSPVTSPWTVELARWVLGCKDKYSLRGVPPDTCTLAPKLLSLVVLCCLGED